jgi:hypothetical protein
VKKAIIAILAGVSAIAVLVTGCGGDDGEASISKAQFLAQGNAICKKGDQAYRDGLTRFLKENPEAAKRFTKAKEAEFSETILVPSLRTQAERLAELGEPKGSEAEAAALVEAFERAVEVGEEDPARFIATNGGDSWKEVGKRAQDVGLVACG